MGHSVSRAPVAVDDEYGLGEAMVTYVDDYMPCSAARASFGKEDKTGEDVEKDDKLMASLVRDQHIGPFEHQTASFLIECPLFIRSQIMRHRTFSYNEISRRYTAENIEFWIPDKLRKQAKRNRQASTDAEVDRQWLVAMEQHCIDSLEAYYDLLNVGVCREQARAVLPQSLITRFYMTGNLRNWAHFLKLRMDSHAQQEVQVVANKIGMELAKLWPKSVEVLLS